mmetsp:Transcript_40502/g.97058  ORF Transcript_40502/g.97058 Transcript_40502/m.97058 type:complete len:242 (+) Transcript_40502:623-1348(+)
MGQVPAVDPQEVPERLVRRRLPLGAPVLDLRYGDQRHRGRGRRRGRSGRRRRESAARRAGGAAAAADQAGQGAGDESHPEAVRGAHGRDLRPALPHQDGLLHHRVVAPAGVRLGHDPHPRGGRDGDVADRARGGRRDVGGRPRPRPQVLGRALLVRHDAHLDWVRRDAAAAVECRRDAPMHPADGDLVGHLGLHHGPDVRHRRLHGSGRGQLPPRDGRAEHVHARARHRKEAPRTAARLLP